MMFSCSTAGDFNKRLYAMDKAQKAGIVDADADDETEAETDST